MKHPSAILLLSILSVMAGSVRVKTIYLGPGSGEWGDAANWSGGVPTATNSAGGRFSWSG